MLNKNCPLQSKASKAGRPKSLEKKAKILLSASELFIEKGYSGTSMDLVSKRAGVSKQTVYSHFSNKDDLFTSVIDAKCEEYEFDSAHINNPDNDLATTLYKVGTQFVDLLQDTGVIGMYRVVIGEVGSNPHVADLFYRAGPQKSIDSLCQYLCESEELALNHEQAYYWTVHFYNLLKGDFHMRSLLGLDYQLTDAQQKQDIQNIVNQLLMLIETY